MSLFILFTGLVLAGVGVNGVVVSLLRLFAHSLDQRVLRHALEERKGALDEERKRLQSARAIALRELRLAHATATRLQDQLDRLSLQQRPVPFR